MSIFENQEANHLESNESRNIHFDLISDDEFCAILSRNEFRDDPEKVVSNFQTAYQEIEKLHLRCKMASTMHLDESGM